MLQERLKHINQLRKAALSNAEFIEASQEHQSAIEAELKTDSTLVIRKRKTKTKQKDTTRFDQRYEGSNFDVNPSGTTH